MDPSLRLSDQHDDSIVSNPRAFSLEDLGVYTLWLSSLEALASCVQLSCRR